LNILMLTSTFPANRDDIMQHPFQLDFIDMLRKDGHNVTVLTHAKSTDHEKVREDLDIIWFPWRIVPGRLAETDFLWSGRVFALLSLVFNGIKYTGRVIAGKKIDLVICLWVIPSGLYMYVNSLLRIKRRAPYVLWALGSDINKYRENLLVRILLRKIIRRSLQVFADGFELCAAVNEISGKRCEFLPTFRRMGESASAARDIVDGVSFLYVGRHTRVKGIDVLMQAIVRLEQASPRLKYHVTIVGEGELTPQMMKTANENNLAHRVKFEGKVPHDRLFGLYAKSDCVIIPSRSESIPVVFSEALQFNKPMIVTDAGDMGVLGKRFGVARVVERENVDALEGAMRDFMENPFQADPAKRDELLSLLTMENSMPKMLDIINGLETCGISGVKPE
jgi:glycosyltransferase involved in cell wall biosynthesis